MEYRQPQLAARHKIFFAGLLFILGSGLLRLLTLAGAPLKAEGVARALLLIGNVAVFFSLIAILDREPSARGKWRWIVFFLLDVIFQVVVFSLTK